MDLRTLPPNLDAEGRCNERRKRVEKNLRLPLSLLAADNDRIGHADERNCEQMLGCVAVPVGYAGPLSVIFSSKEQRVIHLPLATTEGALVASINRGCKALSTNGVRASSVNRGITRSLAFFLPKEGQTFTAALTKNTKDWQAAAEGTSAHLKLLRFDCDEKDDHIFLTIAFDTDEAMGMNMATIAAQAAGDWIAEHLLPATGRFVTVAGNVDSDKKPSLRTKQKGRGYDVSVQATIGAATIKDVLKTSAQAMADIARAKLRAGSTVAMALGKNLQAANIIAALYIATGQDPAHVVEGSLADTIVTMERDDLCIAVHLPAIIVGVRGGGTSLPAQKQCLDMLLHPKTSLHRKAQLAESIGAAVLAGELSLLAAQANHTLAKAHKKLAR